MKFIKNNQDLETYRAELEKSKCTIGFVPTMGALHGGHIALLDQAKKECDITVVSIFVNPMQFNNPDDLEKYPRRLDEDFELLAENGCDYVFLPTKELIYPEDFKKVDIDISHLDREMEGKYRPGHFIGVVNVIHQFFKLLNPQKAYFGKKDFQQVVVVKHLVEQLNSPVEIVPVETLREVNGLAMSSRNYRLSEEDKLKAGIIYESFKLGEKLAPQKSPDEVRNEMIDLIAKSDLKLEYLEIVDTNSMEFLENHWTNSATACIAAYCNGVRLIDNKEIYNK